MSSSSRLRSWTDRALVALPAVLGAVAGLTPHVLHHIGPIAGAAILTGTQGSVLFGAIGIALTLPLLISLKNRFGSWLAPAIAMAVFLMMFAVSTLWVGPWVRGDSNEEGPTPEHQHHTTLRRGDRPTLSTTVIALIGSESR